MRRWSLLRRVWCDTDLPDELIETCRVGDPDRLLFSSIPLQVKDKCVVARYESGATSLLVKRHNWGSLSRTLRMVFRVPAAWSCAEYGLLLHNSGVRTPRPRASVLFRIGPWTYRSYLITDYVEGTSLYRFIRFGQQTADELRPIAAQVARIWQQLVALGISHNDLKPENFIVDENRDVWLIDLEKLRIGGDAQRQRSRQAYDVSNFLHIRSWHQRAEARAIFAAAFLQTSFRESSRAAVVGQIAATGAPLETECDAGLSVLIRCQGGIQKALPWQAIESVQDIADEVVLVEVTGNDCFKVLKRIEICNRPATRVGANAALAATGSASQIARCPWMLALDQNECATPFLAKELQQRIGDTAANAAYRIPLKRQYFGQTVRKADGERPVRLFLASECSFSAGQGGIQITAAPGRIAVLEGSILACDCATVAKFVERLNESTTQAAQRRLQAADEPRLIWAAWRSVAKLVAACLRPSVWRSGWTGLQMAVLESGFHWVEEAKLYQLTGEFHHSAVQDGASTSDAATGTNHGDSLTPWWSEAA